MIISTTNLFAFETKVESFFKSKKDNIFIRYLMLEKAQYHSFRYVIIEVDKLLNKGYSNLLERIYQEDDSLREVESINLRFIQEHNLQVLHILYYKIIEYLIYNMNTFDVCNFYSFLEDMVNLSIDECYQEKIKIKIYGRKELIKEGKDYKNITKEEFIEYINRDSNTIRKDRCCELTNMYVFIMKHKFRGNSLYDEIIKLFDEYKYLNLYELIDFIDYKIHKEDMVNLAYYFIDNEYYINCFNNGDK